MINCDLRNQYLDPRYRIDFITDYIHFLQLFIDHILCKKGASDPIATIKNEYGIIIQDFSSDEKIARFILNLFPKHLLMLNTTKKIIFCANYHAYFANSFISLYPKKESMIITSKDQDQWKGTHIPIFGFSVPINEWGSIGDINFYVNEIRIWDTNDYIGDESVIRIYQLYTLIHEFAHGLYRFMTNINPSNKWYVLFKNNKSYLKDFFSNWLEICQIEQTPVSWYSAFYIHDFVENIAKRKDTLKYLCAGNEEFAECFLAYTFDFILDWRGKAGQFSQMDLGTGVPSKKYKFMKNLWRGSLIR